MSTTSSTHVAARACAACIYWKPEAKDLGECRRHAPQTIAFRIDAETKFESRFPETKAEDWCGDFTVRS